jgi:hypothetical protein
MVWQQRRMLFVETSMYFPLMHHQRYLWMGSLKTALVEKQHIFSARSLASKKYALFTKMQSEWYFALWSLRIPDVQLQPWRPCKVHLKLKLSVLESLQTAKVREVNGCWPLLLFRSGVSVTCHT